MNRISLAAAVLSISGGAALHGQTMIDKVHEGTSSFQYVMNDQFTVTPDQPEAATRVMIGAASAGGKVVTGKPFLGTEERHSVHVLGDGTRIETTDTDKIYRDDKGRTRIERNFGKDVTIHDPVSGMTAELNTVNKTVRKSMVRVTYTTSARPVAAAGSQADVLRKQAAELDAQGAQMTMSMSRSSSASSGADAVQVKLMTEELTKQLMADAVAGPATATLVTGAPAAKTPKDDLGMQMVNGVMSQGSRSTLVIPVGQIGNDRPINVVSEQWYSNDLQMMVKSSNSDPRFGDTTYQLTGVVQVSPDPSLFLIPADYTPASGATSLFVPRAATAGK